MVHRSGSTHQYVEIADNEESSEISIKGEKKPLDTPSQESLPEPEAAAEKPAAPLQIKRGTRTSQRLKSVSLDSLRLPAKEKTNVNRLPSPPPPPTNGIASAIFDRKSIRARRNTITDCVQSLSFRSERNIAVPFLSKFKKLSTKNEPQTSTAKARASASKSDTEDFEGHPLIPADRLNCSVSLERLTGIIDNLVVNKMSDGDEAGTAANKTLCLYCDRSFSSQKLHSKHLERVHHSPSGRRLSARTTLAAPSTVYAGCSYCNVGKITCLPADELLPLLHHLVDEHSDKYFACKECMQRFSTDEILQLHLDEVHQGGDSRTSSSKKSSLLSKRRVKALSKSEKDLRSPLEVQVDFDNELSTMDESQSSEDPSMRSRLRRTKNAHNKIAMLRKKQILHNGETTISMTLSRLGLAQNRSPRTMKGAKNQRGAPTEQFRSETPSNRSMRSNKSTRSTSSLANAPETSEFGGASKASVSSKPETIGGTFDEDFYESVNGNVKQNLSCHLDGKLESGPMSPSPMSPVEAVPAVRSILVKSPQITDSEIHEATTISALTAFPTLLTAQQYGFDPLHAGKMKKPITRHSWKWKWDCVKKYKYVNEGGKIVKKIKQPVAGIRDLSKLDMWTQLTMRSKHEVIARQENQVSGEDNLLSVSEAAREEKRKVIGQLNKILDTRVLPQINLEQNDQSIIKLERTDEARGSETATSLVAASTSGIQKSDSDFPAQLDLIKLERPGHKPNLVLSGEWARPRCYICFGCGGKFETVRSLEEHKASKHPYVHSTHYEIVGKELIDGNLLQNFYIPSAALQRHSEYNKRLNFANMAEDSMDSETSYTTISMSKSESIDMDSNSRNSKVSMSSSITTTSRSSIDEGSVDSANKSVCTKCSRNCNGSIELYRHMLDCSSDYIWILAKKRQNIKYRYFGSRRRRGHRPNAGLRKMVRPKKEETSDTASQKSKEPTTPRPRPSDGKLIDVNYS